ncbi:MAG: S49 family peptidase [Betaproteobacteria bacterium]
MADGDNWERSVLEKLALAALKEQRAARQWGIFFKLIGFGLFVVVLGTLLGWFETRDGTSSGKHTAIVELSGVIEPDGRASAENIIAGLQAAFKDKDTQGVILRINSPGGSPVQSGQINDEMRRLKAKYPNTPLYAVVEDVCASGGYYVAVAADKIYVNKASLVGSIGVILDGFGVVGAMEKIGVERRVQTAGSNKAFLDPFSPASPEQQKYAQQMLDEIHKQFIDVVKAGRGARLKETPELFSGLVWNGARSIEMGLADELGSVEQVARDTIKAEDMVDYTVKEKLTDRLARRFGALLGTGFASTMTQFKLR